MGFEETQDGPPSPVGDNNNSKDPQDDNSNNNTNKDGSNMDEKDGGKQGSGAEDSKAVLAQSCTAIIAVALTFTLLF